MKLVLVLVVVVVVDTRASRTPGAIRTVSAIVTIGISRTASATRTPRSLRMAVAVLHDMLMQMQMSLIVIGKITDVLSMLGVLSFAALGGGAVSPKLVGTTSSAAKMVIESWSESGPMWLFESLPSYTC